MIDLIPISYLNEACFLSLNVDDKKYKMVLKVAQDTLKTVLGEEFYDQIVTQYSSNPQSLSTDNEALYEGYIKDYLAWQTYFYYLKFANLDSTPTGLREFNDENSSIASDIKMYSVERNVKEFVNRYKGMMITFLKLEQEKDSSKYPLFTNTCEYGFDFGITAVDKKSDAMYKVNKSIITNE